MANLGIDILTDANDIDPTFALDTPEHTWAAAVMRRLLHDPGALWWAPDTGHNIMQYFGTPFDKTSTETNISTECEKDERTKKATVTAFMHPDGKTLELDIQLEPVDSDEVLTLTLSVGAAGEILNQSIT